MFGMVIERVVLTDLQKISDISEKCVVAKGVIHLLNDQEYMVNGRFTHLWPSLFEVIFNLNINFLPVNFLKVL